jgi:hypothetical protein
MSFGAIKRTAADAWFSKCVRLRARYRCEVCDTEYTNGTKDKPSIQYARSDQGLHCSHHFGRRHKATRTEPLNCISACFGCHRKLEANPLYHVRFFQNLLGIDIYEIISEKHRLLIPKTQYNENEQSKHFKTEFFRQLEESELHDGRLEFRGYI